MAISALTGGADPAALQAAVNGLDAMAAGGEMGDPNLDQSPGGAGGDKPLTSRYRQVALSAEELRIP